VVTKVWERLAVSKQKLGGQRFNFMKLNELQFRKKHQIEITNRFAALENLSEGENRKRVSENIKENITTSAKESLGLRECKQHKQRLDKECLGFFRSKEAG
jgi:hypothetical protein